MKKVVSYVLLCSLLFSLLILPASAAESEEYVFEYFEMPALYAEYPFELDENYTCFLMEGYLPEGVYKTSIICGDYPDGTVSNYYFEINEPFNVRYENYPDLKVCFLELTVSLYYKFNGALLGSEVVPYLILYEDGYTCIGLYGTNDISEMSFVDQLILISYDPVYEDIVSVSSALRSNLQDLTGMNLTTIILAGIGIAAAPAIAWCGYRFIKRKAIGAFKKGKL